MAAPTKPLESPSPSVLTWLTHHEKLYARHLAGATIGELARERRCSWENIRNILKRGEALAKIRARYPLGCDWRKIPVGDCVDLNIRIRHGLDRHEFATMGDVVAAIDDGSLTMQGMTNIGSQSWRQLMRWITSRPEPASPPPPPSVTGRFLRTRTDNRASRVAPMEAALPLAVLTLHKNRAIMAARRAAAAQAEKKRLAAEARARDREEQRAIARAREEARQTRLKALAVTETRKTLEDSLKWQREEVANIAGRSLFSLWSLAGSATVAVCVWLDYLLWGFIARHPKLDYTAPVLWGAIIVWFAWLLWIEPVFMPLVTRKRDLAAMRLKLDETIGDLGRLEQGQYRIELERYHSYYSTTPYEVRFQTA